MFMYVRVSEIEQAKSKGGRWIWIDRSNNCMKCEYVTSVMQELDQSCNNVTNFITLWRWQQNMIWGKIVWHLIYGSNLKV